MNSKLPIVVDLDGTIIKTDLLIESLSQYLTANPLSVFKIFFWIIFLGKSSLKSKLAQIIDIDVKLLPYNRSLIIWLEEKKKSGSHLILATASHNKYAQQISEYLNIFDDAFGTTKDINLKSQNKRDFLIDKYGYKKFSYVGDSVADLPIWLSCKDAYVVDGSPKLLNSLSELGIHSELFSSGKPHAFKSFIKALRLHQWLKNLLVFIPLFATQSYLNLDAVFHASIAFILFGITASSAYLLNDLVDVGNDRHHPSKRNRPFASGDLSLLMGWFSFPALLAISFITAYFLLPYEFVAILFIYLAITLAYSFSLKRIVLVDVLVLAILYTVRIIAGAAATDLPISLWLLSFSIFFFLSLALMKRFSELQISKEEGGEKKLLGRGYLPIDFEVISSMGVASGYISVLILGLYFQDPKVSYQYQNSAVLWIACPILLYWVSRMWLLTHRGEMDHDPVYFAAKDKCSWVVIFLITIIFLFASF